MCKHSLEEYTQRQAVKGETIVVSAALHGQGMFAPKDGSKQLACVLDKTVLTIEKFQPVINVTKGYNAVGANGMDIQSYVGKRLVVEFRDGRYTPIGHDCIFIDREILVPVAWLKRGTEAYVGIKEVPKTLDEKLHLDDASIKGAALDAMEPIVEHQAPKEMTLVPRRKDYAEGDD